MPELTTERCPVTELIVTGCAHCRGLNPERHTQPRKPASWPAFPARFGGHCSGCGERFEPGTRIRPDGQGGYLADCCQEDRP